MTGFNEILLRFDNYTYTFPGEFFFPFLMLKMWSNNAYLRSTGKVTCDFWAEWVKVAASTSIRNILDENPGEKIKLKEIGLKGRII
jgi:hypothetical protein